MLNVETHQINQYWKEGSGILKLLKCMQIFANFVDLVLALKSRWHFSIVEFNSPRL